MRKGMGVLIFGRGWIGSRLKELMSQDRWVGEVRLSVLDITDEPVLEDEIINFRPDAIINAAGFTGGKEGIDYCDKDKVGAYRSNVLGVSVLADICAQRGIYLVHLSTADVFNGHRYYAGQYFDENFRPKTVGYYAETKLAGESVLMASPAQFCILRLNMPFDEKPHPRNLITKIVKSGQLNGGLHSITHL
jgi:dTDP-4-dehydrorhamnose reductase